MFHLAFYVPVSHVEEVKEALFAAGAGKLGNYQCCSFESAGTGQFKPLEGSNPFLGERGVLEKVSELKVEMICMREYLPAVISALKEVHPYETPAYYVIETVNI